MLTNFLSIPHSQADVDAVNEEEIPLPEKPERRNPDDIRTAIEGKYQNAIRPAGKSIRPERLIATFSSVQTNRKSSWNSSITNLSRLIPNAQRSFLRSRLSRRNVEIVFRIERARRYAVQASSNLSARILINDKVIADTTSM